MNLNLRCKMAIRMIKNEWTLISLNPTSATYKLYQENSLCVSDRKLNPQKL